MSDVVRTITEKKTYDGKILYTVKDAITVGEIECSRSIWHYSAEIAVQEVEKHHFVSPNTEPVGVVCGGCRGTEFQVGYRYYKCAATCVKCGRWDFVAED